MNGALDNCRSSVRVVSSSGDSQQQCYYVKRWSPRCVRDDIVTQRRASSPSLCVSDVMKGLVVWFSSLAKPDPFSVSASAVMEK